MTLSIDQLCADYTDHFPTEFRATIKLNWHQGTAYLRIDHEGCRALPAIPDRVDLELLFRDAQLAESLLRGTAEPVRAFMQGDFRASGYIVWAFMLLRCFPATPACK